LDDFGIDRRINFLEIEGQGVDRIMGFYEHSTRPLVTIYGEIPYQ
jgi:hypothetical protein